MNPSLLLIPDRYKASKLYSQIPDSGAGDLAFTRANDTATRVNSEGLIEKVRTNVVLYSEQFNDAYWIKLGTSLTVSSDTTIAPNGTLTADTLNVSNNDNALYGVRAAAIAGNEFTFSIYAKGTGTFSMNIRLNSVTITTETKTLTSEWQRFSVSVTNAVPVVSVEFFLALNTSSTYNVWGAQVESGPVATPYIPTTTAAVSVGPVADIPRIDYTGGGCGKLLLEPQRTNNVTYSEQLNNAAWILANSGSASAAVVTANYGISPDGTQNADRVQFSRTGTTSSDYSLLDRSTISTAAGVVSFYGKSLSGTQSILLYYGGVGQVFTLTTEWQRFSLYNPTTTTDLTIGTRGGSGNYFNGGSLTIDCLLWGFQKEAGAYPTSYIPTLGASVTRSADSASKTGISSLIGQTSGTVFLDIDLENAPIDNSYIILRNASVTDYIGLRIFSGTLRFEVVDDSVLQVAIDRATITTGRVKIAMAYSLNDFVMYANGTQIGTDTSGTVPTCDILDLNFNAPSANAFSINTAATYTTRLSNAELQTLTTL